MADALVVDGQVKRKLKDALLKLRVQAKEDQESIRNVKASLMQVQAAYAQGAHRSSLSAGNVGGVCRAHSSSPRCSVSERVLLLAAHSIGAYLKVDSDR